MIKEEKKTETQETRRREKRLKPEEERDANE